MQMVLKIISQIVSKKIGNDTIFML